MAMPETEIDEKDHVARYCKPPCVRADGLPLACAFQLRLKLNENYLSVNWLEYFNELNLARAVDCVRQVFRNKGYRPASSGRFAVLQVDQIKSVISSLSPKPFRVKYLPTAKDPSHTGIFGYTASDKLIALKISELACAEDMHLTKLP